MRVTDSLSQGTLSSCQHWSLPGYSDHLCCPVTAWLHTEVANLSIRLQWQRLAGSLGPPYILHTRRFIGASPFIKHYCHFTGNSQLSGRNQDSSSGSQVPPRTRVPFHPGTLNQEVWLHTAGTQPPHLPKVLLYMAHIFLQLVLRHSLQPLP